MPKWLIFVEELGGPKSNSSSEDGAWDDCPKK